MTATTTPLAQVPAALKTGRLVGYARVSTNEQDPQAQADKITAHGVTDALLFSDHGASGTKASRPQWDKCRAALRPGDTLVIVRLDRVGRSVRNLLDVISELEARQVNLVVLDQSIDLSTPTGRLLLHMLAAIAVFERDLIIERTLDGQATVRASGNFARTQGGLPPLGFQLLEGQADWSLHGPTADLLRAVATLMLEDGMPLGTAFKAQPATLDSQGRPVT